MDTPWAEYLTTAPETITCLRVPHQREGNHINLLMTLGDVRDPLVFARIDTINSAIYVKDPAELLDTHMPKYWLQFPQWTHNRPPCIDLHPFAILHLLATEQVSRQEMLQLAFRAAGGTPSLTLEVTDRSSHLLRLLAVPRAVLRFQSTYDLRIRVLGFA